MIKLDIRGIKTKPKSVRLEGWVNIYLDGSGRYCGYIWDTKEEAMDEGAADRLAQNYITTAKIEWEEAQQ